MKKIFLFFICTLMLLNITSCKNVETIEQQPLDKSLYHIESYFKEATDNFDLAFDIFETKDYDGYEYVDSQAQQTIAVEILGKTYTANYEYSFIKGCTDVEFDKYVYDNGSKHFPMQIYVNKKDKKIASYSEVPMDSFPIEEVEYLDLIGTMVGDEHDLSKYKYSCVTYYGKYYDDGVGFEANVVQGFKKANENELILDYTFRFEKQVGGISSNEGITVVFQNYSQRVTLDMRDYGNKNYMFDPIFEFLPEIESNIESCVRDHAKEGVVIHDIKIEHASMFIMNGKPHIWSVAIVDAFIPEFINENEAVRLYFVSEIVENE
ncbi:MAG: hypothetical protein E7607_07360 [Ruminococcaceae bacterium]|nr:hypothetical protein [Oscillospiraceae bacterium]